VGEKTHKESDASIITILRERMVPKIKRATTTKRKEREKNTYEVNQANDRSLKREQDMR